MNAIIHRLGKSRVVQNMLALYGVQLCRKIIPILSIPYLTRTLGPAGWGAMAFALSAASFLVLLVEFGFNISATREIALHRESREECAEVIAGVLGAQVALCVIGVGAVCLFARHIRFLGANPALLGAALFFAVSQCFTPLWFFQGMEWMRSASVLEISGKVLAFAGLLAFVHSPADVWKALALQAIPFLLLSCVGIALIYREFPFRWPSWPSVRKSVVRGWPMFLFRSGVSLYTSANAFLLGMYFQPEIVGYYAAAERINSPILGLLNPIQDALFPRLSRATKESPRAAAKLALAGGALTLLVGLCLPLGVWFLAPLLIRILAGPKFSPSVGVLRVLVFLMPFAAISIAVSVQYLLPLGKDRLVTAVTLCGGALNLVLAMTLAPRFAAEGMAWAAVISEASVGLTLLWAVFRFTDVSARFGSRREILEAWQNWTRNDATELIKP